MKFIFTIIIGLLILSCNKTNESQNDIQQLTKSTDLNTENIEEKVDEDEEAETSPFEIQNKVFEIGSKTHFTNECSFYFECDCCSGELIFNSDSTFYYIDYCMSDETVRKGNFNFKNNFYVLEYGSEGVVKEYNYEREFDTTAVEYFKSDTILKTVIIEYFPRLCDNKIMLEDKKHEEYAIEVSSDYDTALEYLNNLYAIQ